MSRRTFETSVLPRALTALLVSACTPALPVPEAGDQAGEVPLTVPYPPPAARVEVLSDPPPEMTAPVWVDGQWLFRGARWIWEPGRWVASDAARLYARSKVVRRSDGTLVWFEGKFRSKRPATEPTPESKTP